MTTKTELAENVPTVLTLKVNEQDKRVVAAVMRVTGIQNTSDLIRFCMHAALRELRVDVSTSNHTPINPG